MTPCATRQILARMKTLVLCILLVPLLAGAQVRKCVDAAGKTIYSDALCKDPAAKQTIVDTDRNTIDHSGLRAQAAKDKAQAVAAAEQEKAAAAKAKKIDGPAELCAAALKWKGAAPTDAESDRADQCLAKAAREFRRP